MKKGDVSDSIVRTRVTLVSEGCETKVSGNEFLLATRNLQLKKERLGIV